MTEEIVWYFIWEILSELSSAALQCWLEVGAWRQALDSPRDMMERSSVLLLLCVSAYKLFFHIFIYIYIYIPLILSGLNTVFFPWVILDNALFTFSTLFYINFNHHFNMTYSLYLFPLVNLAKMNLRYFWDILVFRELVLSTLWKSVSFTMLVIYTKLKALQKLSMYENIGCSLQVWFSNRNRNINSIW